MDGGLKGRGGFRRKHLANVRWAPYNPLLLLHSPGAEKNCGPRPACSSVDGSRKPGKTLFWSQVEAGCSPAPSPFFPIASSLP